MARKPRLHYIGALYHVMVRGNGGQNIFSDEADRFRFYLFLQEGVEKYGHRIHAFCLMNNHVRLAIQVGEKPLSRVMQNLCFRYTQWANGKQKKVDIYSGVGTRPLWLILAQNLSRKVQTQNIAFNQTRD